MPLPITSLNAPAESSVPCSERRAFLLTPGGWEPGLKINLSKTGASVTVGPRGAHLTVGRGRPKISLDLPGTGIYYRRTLGESNSQHDKKMETEATAEQGAQPDHNGAQKDDKQQD